MKSLTIRRAVSALAVMLAFASALPAHGSAPTLRFADSFRVGSSGVLCTAQTRSVDAFLVSMFDRGYTIACRDAAAPVGRVFAFSGDARARVFGPRSDGLTCEAPVAAMVDDIGMVDQATCTDPRSGLRHSLYFARHGNNSFFAEGLSGYSSALVLALRTVILDRPVDGEVQVGATNAGDPAAFARVQAGQLDPDQALSEAYARNNAGNFAEAAAFFDLLVERSRQESAGFNRSSEYLANRALQESNLGNFVEAEATFRQAQRAADASDGLQLRMLRNFRALHSLNRRNPLEALVELSSPVPDIGDSGIARDRLSAGYIDQPIAQRLNTDDASVTSLAGVDSRLTRAERGAILDAQTLYLRGAALRSTDLPARARDALLGSIAALQSVREGRVRSTAWLQAAALTELAELAESSGNPGEARRYLDQSLSLYTAVYPGSAALLAARARIAALSYRQGNAAAAASEFQDIIRQTSTTAGASAVIRPLVRPYFDLLAERGSQDTAAAADFFEASQILTRPGVAQTQAVLARELSSGNDEAATLFRQSLTLTRDIYRLDAEIARLGALPEGNAETSQSLAAARAARDELSRDQSGVLARLSEFPRYRAVTSDIMPVAELQSKLRDGEAYYKLVLVDDKAFGVLVMRDSARLFPISISVAAMGTMVAAIRDSIVRIEGGVPTTDPFDAVKARELYSALFGPVDSEMAAVRHLIFEPDGPMLQLPVNLLITQQAGLDRYVARSGAPGGDPYDMTGIAWLGRNRMVSTSVSPRAFADIRGIAPSRARRAYLGLGGNALPAPPVRPAGVNTTVSSAPPIPDLPPPPVAQPSPAQLQRAACDWPLSTWQHPIAVTELTIAANALRDQGAETDTGVMFSDTALLGRQDLNDFRIVHFATHGLVTAPRPECGARPALLTSFGDANSDGLLSFKEIFDLRLDADTVILSACDTAGMATVAATREAGISTGGNFALDGLVRSFVGAGSRTVIASHWPVPDDFNATSRLMTALFSAPPDTGVAEAMRQSTTALMDDPVTSHPYYWSAFAIVGDGARPLQ